MRARHCWRVPGWVAQFVRSSIHQGFGFGPQSGHILQDSTNNWVNKWNNKSIFLPPYFLPFLPYPLSLKSVCFFKKGRLCPGSLNGTEVAVVPRQPNLLESVLWNFGEIHCLGCFGKATYWEVSHQKNFATVADLQESKVFFNVSPVPSVDKLTLFHLAKEKWLRVQINFYR